ncbi:MAG: peptidase S58 [Acidobacteria bacterium RIFCSPLOWO2_12_FULL_67_14]|nr:MAG: peptidase S58 [Acidobacteria bacterium RIFCSPLOWO2_02_FULL_67_21]OFW35458.1 MAG: peptidase S58 [Acidobacteria bacterium RIFCSPLOWO2_12_FULL_67_14]
MRALAAAVVGVIAAYATLHGQGTGVMHGKGLTDVEGLKVGHHTLAERPTGCTVILVDGAGAAGGVSQRGAAPGTRETDLLNPLNLVDKVNAIVFSGGSAYGLDAAQGVVRYLEERKIGWPVGAAGVVPIVPSAILFDLAFGGDSRVRPTADCGYRAASSASDGPVAEGNVGAGAGATVGKVAGRERSMKGGIGSASIRLPNGLVVGALAAVNAIGDIIDPASGQVVAGVRSADGRGLADARTLLRDGSLMRAVAPRAGENSTLALVATNARLSKPEVSRVALMADDGLARAIVPAHTVGDGDTVFALATGRWSGTADASIVGALAADVLAEAIVRAAVQAAGLGGLPSARDLGTVPARYK